MRRRIRVPRAIRPAWQRAVSAWRPVALAAVAAAIAWWIAHRLLGHPQPFFAPIAAAIALSTSWIQRARRTAQMITGVLIGIGIGEALGSTLGTSTTALGVIVFATMIVARLSGVGFFGEGMMFANQAAASAILVVTLHRHGTGGERLLDAAVGGAVAFLIGVVLFPAQPLALLREAERCVLRVLGRTLEQVVQVLEGGTIPERDWALRASHEVQRELAALAQARSTAWANVRIAPRRWHLRVPVANEISRISQLDLLANAVLGLVRGAGTTTFGDRPLEASLRQPLLELTDGIRRLAATPQPWPDDLVQSVDEITARVSGRVDPDMTDRGAIVASVLHAAADDLSHVVERVRTPAGSAPGRDS